MQFRVPGIELKNPSSPEIGKKYEIPHPRSGPENTKKIQKKYKNGDFWAVFGIFLHFFHIFGARPGVGDFIFFSYFFVFEGFLSSIPGTRNGNKCRCSQIFCRINCFEPEVCVCNRNDLKFKGESVYVIKLFCQHSHRSVSVMDMYSIWQHTSRKRAE